MNRVGSFTKSSAILLLLAAIFLISSAVLPGFSASAAEEKAADTFTFAQVTIPANSSYVTDDYFGVLNLRVQDNTVACASLDSQNRVVITAVSAGNTDVTFWYRNAAGADWTSAVLPVEVSGTSEEPVSLSTGSVGVVFPTLSVSLSAGTTYTVVGLKLNGFSVSAEELLWMAEPNSAFTVDTATGLIHGLSSGKGTLYALDPKTKTCNSVAVTVL